MDTITSKPGHLLTRQPVRRQPSRRNCSLLSQHFRWLFCATFDFFFIDFDLFCHYRDNLHEDLQKTFVYCKYECYSLSI